MRVVMCLLGLLLAGCAAPPDWLDGADDCTGSSVSQVLAWPAAADAQAEEEMAATWRAAGLTETHPAMGIPVPVPPSWGSTNLTRVAWAPFGGRADGGQTIGYVDGEPHIGNQSWTLHTWAGHPVVEGLFLAETPIEDLTQSLTTFLDQLRRVDHEEHVRLAETIVAQGTPFHVLQQIDENGRPVETGPALGIAFKAEVSEAPWRDLSTRIEQAETTFDLGSAQASSGAWLYHMDRSRWRLQSERDGGAWHRLDFDRLGHGHLYAELDGPINATAAVTLADALLGAHGLSDAQRIGAPRIDGAICT